MVNFETIIGETVLSPATEVDLPAAVRSRFRLRPPVAPPAAAFNRRRRQFDAARLLAEIDLPEGSGPNIFVVPADLYLSRRPFVFGAADPGAGRAVVSTFRLEGSAARLLSVLLHELAHLAGWEDCADPDCLLHSAATAIAIDRRGPALCAACRRLIT